MNSSISSSRYRVLVFFAIFLPGLFVIFGAAEWAARNSGQEREIKAFRQVMLQGGPGIPVFGDSHVTNALQALDGIDDAWTNLGWKGHSLDETLDLARTYVKRHDPRHIVLQADPQFLAPYRLDGGYFRGNRDLTAEPAGLLRILSPMHRQYFGDYLRHLAGQLVKDVAETPASADFLRHNPSWHNVAAIRAQTHQPVGVGDFSPLLSGYRRLLDEWTGEGRQICMVSYPLSSYYRAAIATRPEFARAADALRQMALQAGVTYIDARLWMHDRYFSDPDHLGPDGSKLFLQRLSDACR